MKILALLLLIPSLVFADDIVVPDLHVRAEDYKPDTVYKTVYVPVEKPCDNMTWTPLEKWMAGITTGLILIDMSQTFSFTKRGVKEMNPLLPDHPTRWQLRAVMIGSITLYCGGSAVLPRPYRTIWQSGFMLGEGAAVYSNHFRVEGGKGSGYAIPW